MTLVEEWDPRELEQLETLTKVRSFALDPAWTEAAVASGFAKPQTLGLRESGSLRSVCVGLRRSRAGFSKVVCGTNGGVGLIADNSVTAATLIREVWRRWRPSEMQIFGTQMVPETRMDWEPSYTIHLDLQDSADTVRDGFKKPARKHLRQALDDGVTGAPAAGDEIEEALDLIATTGREKGFPLPPRAYLKALHLAFVASGMSELIVAKRDDKLLAAIHVLGARGVATWWKGGASTEGYAFNAPTVALWTAIQVAAERRFRTFDMGGTHPTDPKYGGIHQYKSSFGGRLVQSYLGSRSTLAARTARRFSSVSP